MLGAIYFYLEATGMSFSNENVKSEQLGHLGLVASVIHDLGIIEKIDARIELNENKDES